MYKLILCEGPNELTIINILLENNCFTFSRNDLTDAINEYRRIKKHNSEQLFLADLLKDKLQHNF